MDTGGGGGLCSHPVGLALSTLYLLAAICFCSATLIIMFKFSGQALLGMTASLRHSLPVDGPRHENAIQLV